MREGGRASEHGREGREPDKRGRERGRERSASEREAGRRRGRQGKREARAPGELVKARPAQ